MLVWLDPFRQYIFVSEGPLDPSGSSSPTQVPSDQGVSGPKSDLGELNKSTRIPPSIRNGQCLSKL